MKIVLNDLNFDGELPSCKCSGVYVPTLRQESIIKCIDHRSDGTKKEYEVKSKLLWKCNKCKNILQ